MKKTIFWSVQGLAISLLQYLYHPSLLLAFIGAVLLIGLVVLSVWSARRSSKGARGLVIASIVAGVSGFMFSQAMDVAYALLSAPEGLRFTVFFETLFAGLWILISALVARAWLPGSEIQEQTSAS